MSNIIQRDAVLPLKSDSYAAFDPVSLKDLFKKRLNDSGIFTEQNNEGSNLAVLNDFVSMAFGSLLFYLNRSSTEGMFTEADIYENMNRIVKLNDYNPQGYHAANLSFSVSATADIPIGAYTIPRYSYINVVGDINYTFPKDISFVKSVSGIEFLQEPSTQQLLYQGKFREHPTITAVGESNELIYLITDSGTKVDHFNIHVYIQPSGTSTWELWEPTSSLYLENANSKRYEIRFNENERYELKFGDGINGVQLTAGDKIAIFYLSTLAQEGEVGAGALLNSDLVAFNSKNYSSILSNVTITNNSLPLTYYGYLLFNNAYPSTYASDPESVEQIRKNAPKTYRSQYRLVTPDDFTSYVKTNFYNIIQDAVVVDNDTFVNGYMKKIYDYGILDPSRESRILFNQINFADACNFNNAYIIAVPRQVTGSLYTSYLTTSQKRLILNTINNSKTKIHTVEPVIMDPIYMAFDVGIPLYGNQISMADLGTAELVIQKDPNLRVNNASIVENVAEIIAEYFARNNMSLGKSIDLYEINNQILGVPGVLSFRTQRIDTPTISIEGLGLVSYSPVYGLPSFISARSNLSFFEFGYLVPNITSKIRVLETAANLSRSVPY